MITEEWRISGKSQCTAGCNYGLELGRYHVTPYQYIDLSLLQYIERVID